MTDREPRSIAPRELGVNAGAEISQVQAQVETPVVLRDERGRMRWTPAGNNPEQRVDIPRDPLGRIKWKQLSQENPALLTSVIEEKAQAVLINGGRITSVGLESVNEYGIIHAISRYYPGGYQALREKVNATTARKPDGYWDSKEAQEEVRQRCSGVLLTTPINSFTQLRKIDKVLATDINAHYHGGWHQLQIDLGLTPHRARAGSYSAEKIEQEARQFYQEHGSLSQADLVNNGHSGLGHAIKRYYPGGLRKLQEKMGIDCPVKEPGFWTPEKVKEEAQAYYKQHKVLSNIHMRKHGRSDLAGIIAQNYPGGWIQLREDMGLYLVYTRSSSWTPDLIEEKAKDFYEEYGDISYPLLEEKKSSRLGRMIASNYPGKMIALKKKLGIVVGESSTESETDELEEYERRLLNGEIMSYEEFMNMKEKQV